MNSRPTAGRNTAISAVVLGMALALIPPIASSSVATSALAQVCVDPTLTGDDPRAQWVEGTMTHDDGAARDFYNQAAALKWDNTMGDWSDANGTAQGSAAFATS